MFGIRFLQYVLKVIAVIFIIGFVALNRDVIDIYYSPLSDPLQIPLWLVGLLLFSFGFTIGILLIWLDSYKYKRDLRSTRKKLDDAEKDRETLGETLHDQQMKTLENKNI